VGPTLLSFRIPDLNALYRHRPIVDWLNKGLNREAGTSYGLDAYINYALDNARMRMA
jgi:hypothetical protein